MFWIRDCPKFTRNCKSQHQLTSHIEILTKLNFDTQRVPLKATNSGPMDLNAFESKDLFGFKLNFFINMNNKVEFIVQRRLTIQIISTY